MIMGKHSLMIKTILNDYKGPTWAFIFCAKNTYYIMRRETNVRTTKLRMVSRILGMITPMNRHGTYERANNSGVRVR